MAERRKRRKWTAEEKCGIVAQTKVPGVSVPQVAHRYDVNANLIFKWVRDPRYGFVVENELELANFLPIEVTPNLPAIEPEQKRPDVPGSIKIVLANGHHLEISGTFDSDVVIRLARGLSE